MDFLFTYFKQYKIIIIALAVITILASVVYSYKYAYDKGYNSGFNTASKQIDQDYQKALENKLAQQKESLENNFKVLLDAEQSKKKTEIKYITVEKEVKEIVKAENLQVEMTDEQFAKFNKIMSK